MHSVDLLYTLSGFCVGVLVGMTGVGGGSLMTPVLILLFGVQPAAAVGTDLLYAAITKGCGTVVYGLNDTIDWRIVRRLCCGSVPASAMTLLLLSRYDVNGGPVQRFISVALGLVLLATAAAMIFRPRLVAAREARFGESGEAVSAVLTAVTGAVLGALVSITSVGAGALGATALVLLYPRLPTLRIVGSDIAHAVPLTLIAGVGHLLLSTVNVSVLAALLLGSLPGILVGSQLAVRVPDPMLRFGLAAVLVIGGGKLVL